MHADPSMACMPSASQAPAPIPWPGPQIPAQEVALSAARNLKKFGAPPPINADPSPGGAA
eukprot:10732267-Alexandrium_andersonii.AAC.1